MQKAVANCYKTNLESLWRPDAERRRRAEKGVIEIVDRYTEQDIGGRSYA